MRLGIVADIRGAADSLGRALAEFHRRQDLIASRAQ